MPAIPIIGAVAAIGGTAVAYSAYKDSKKAAGAAQNFANESNSTTGGFQDSGPSASSPVNYNTAHDYFRDHVYSGSAAHDTPEWNDAFNQWTQGLEQQNGVSSYQNLNYGQLTGQTAANGVIPSSIAGPGGTIDLNAAQQAAQVIAAQNAANSAALENQYNPGASQVRNDSLQALLASINAPQQGIQGSLPSSASNDALLAQIGAQAGQPLTNVGYDSPLTRAAIAKAQSDLALGGVLPQDVAQLVARRAYAQAGNVTGGRGLGNGRDISARDLGLTSLDLENARLQNALQAGGAEVNLNQGISNQSLAAQQYARNNLLQSQGATAADLARQSSDYFNQNSLLQSIQNGQFSRNLAAAQFGQGITPPQSGLDPGALVNLAVGNSNTAANAQQNANALAAQAANQQSALGGQLLGAGLGIASNYFKPTPAPSYYYSPATPTTPTTYGTVGYVPTNNTYSSSIPPVFCWVAREVFSADNPEWIGFRDWLLSSGSPEFVDFYGKNGEAIAESIKDQPAVKTLIRHLMLAAKGGRVT